MLFGHATKKTRHLLKSCLEGYRPSTEELTYLLGLQGRDALALHVAADILREELVGDVVTYVVNRNLTFTNVCYKGCKFCAFSVPQRSSRNYFYITKEEFRERIKNVPWKITEVCLQGGIHPQLEYDMYLQAIRDIKEIDPRIHVHAYSPEEVQDMIEKSGLDLDEVLKDLRHSGLGSLPGTAAEILSDDVRKIICPKKINAARWIEIITTAHELGIPTTSTIMYGHVETLRHRALHLKTILTIQQETGGFTEFVPLSFVYENTPLRKLGLVTRPPSGMEILNLHAVARLLFQEDLKNIQVSWVKLGPQFAQTVLNAGANDFGGTLFEERITSSANDGKFGDHLTPMQIRQLILDVDRHPQERTTLYQHVRRDVNGEWHVENETVPELVISR